MGFIIILALSAFSIAGTAAWFSVVGLSSIFAGTSLAVIVMGSVLEFGKLVAASYTYRFWNTISIITKTYLITAIFGLMLITSAGIFGQLSKGYQTDTIPLRDITTQLNSLENEKISLQDRKKQIDGIIASISPNYITKRMELIDKLSPETSKINARIPIIIQRIRDLKTTQISEEGKVGPIIYIAKAFNCTVDEATKWMILLIIFVFDPLAVTLTIATNNALMQRQANKRISSGVSLDNNTQNKSEEFSFSTDDLIEPIDDLNFDIDPLSNSSSSSTQGIPNVEASDEHQPEDIIDTLRILFPTYNITDNINDTLQLFITKQSDDHLTTREREQIGRIIKTLQALI